MDRAYNKDQAKQIIDAILPLMAQTGMTVADTFDFRNYELDKLVVTPDSALHPIWLAIRHCPHILRMKRLLEMCVGKPPRIFVF